MVGIEPTAYSFITIAVSSIAAN